MDQPRARFAQQQRADAGIAEQVEHVGVRRAARASSPIAAPCRERSRGGGTASARRRSGPSPRASSHCRGTGRCWTQRPPPSSSEPGTKVASGSQSSRAGAHIACGSGRTTLNVAVALELLAIAAIDQAPVGPRLGDQRGEVAHAARTAGTPMVAVAARPAKHRSRRPLAPLPGSPRRAARRPRPARPAGRKPPAAAPRRTPARHGVSRCISSPAAARAADPLELALGHAADAVAQDLVDQLRRRRRPRAARSRRGRRTGPVSANGWTFALTL